MARSKRLQLLLTEIEFEILKSYANSQQLSVSEVLRDYIKTLKKPSVKACPESVEGTGFKTHFSDKIEQKSNV